MIRIKWSITFNAINFNRVVTSCPLMIFPIRVIDWSTLTSYSHDLRLIPCCFQIWIFLAFLTPLILCILIDFIKLWWRSISFEFNRVKVFLFISTSWTIMRLRICLIIVHSGIRFVFRCRYFCRGMLNCTHIVLIPIFDVGQLWQQRTTILIGLKWWTW